MKSMSFTLITLLCTFLLFSPEVMAIDAVASFGKLDGNVQVLRESRKIPGRAGLILNDKDVVVTGRSSRVTIIFRDGSEIRLFEDTRFIIERSQESTEGDRRFFYNFKLKLGSFWGRFSKGKQNTLVETPSATIGIKVTNVAFSQTGGRLDIALSEGKVSVDNEDGSINLEAGYRLKGVSKHGDFKSKLSKMPYQVSIKPDNPKITIPAKGEVEEMFFSIQLIDSRTKQNYGKKGMVFISLDNDKLIFPDGIQLNKRGYARIKATIKPFQKVNYKNGQLEVFAVVGGKQAMNIAAGQTLLIYDVPQKIKRIIRVDMTTGHIGSH